MHVIEFIFYIFSCFLTYRATSPYCLAYPCPSVIYVKFPGSGQMHYGGFYVIDGILPRYSVLGG